MSTACDEIKNSTFYENMFNSTSVWYVMHCGCCLCLSIKSTYVLCDQFIIEIVTCFILNFLKADLHSPKAGLIKQSLLWMLLFQHFCQFIWRNLLISGFKSVYEILNLSGTRSKANLAAKSAPLFPLTPMWLRIQLIRIFRIEYGVQSTQEFND